jgi:hypothetical protein
LKNLKIDLSKLLELGAHTAIITIHEISHLNPLLLAFGVILLGRLGWEATAIKISEQEASVFWGLLKAQDEQSNGQSVSEAVVVAVTNRERGKDRNGVRLGAPLPQEAVRRSLESLEKIGSVVHEDEEGQSTRWRIAERYQVKNEGSRP